MVNYVVLLSIFLTQGNHTELCKNCKNTYRRVNELYSGMEKNNTMCIDIEDAVSMSDLYNSCLRWEERKLHPLEESKDN